jgi:hypothetical protein
MRRRVTVEGAVKSVASTGSQITNTCRCESRWLGSFWIRGIFDGEHSLRLESDGGRTHLIQAERFSGLLAGKLSDSILRKTQCGFVAMNEALKERAESH